MNLLTTMMSSEQQISLVVELNMCCIVASVRFCCFSLFCVNSVFIARIFTAIHAHSFSFLSFLFPLEHVQHSTPHLNTIYVVPHTRPPVNHTSS